MFSSKGGNYCLPITKSATIAPMALTYYFQLAFDYYRLILPMLIYILYIVSLRIHVF